MTEQPKKAWLYRYKVLGVVVAVIAGLALIFGLHSGKVCAVMVDGKAIAYAESTGAAEKAIEQLSAAKSSALGQEVIAGTGLELKVIKSSKTPLEDRELINILAKKVDFFTEGVLVKINGKPELRFKNRAMAEKFFNQLKDKYRHGENCEISLVEKIEIIDQEINIEHLNTIGEALRLAEKGRGEPDVHIVQKNDTLWDLALANNTTVEKLKDLNPGIDENLQLGQEIKVSGSAPLLTVLAGYEITEEQTIPFTTEFRNDSSLLLGTRKTVQEGKEGSKKVTYRVLAKNGIVTEKTVLKEEIVTEPVPRIVKKGTKFVLSSRGGGLIWPTTGSLSSPFGMRWGRLHSGIDIASGYGNSVWAAGPGRVISAGWNGGYGRMVEIAHGSGVTTRYAHLSSIGVSVGQTVDRGQFIGRIGTSGNSTGPHLHFEVRINDIPRNPLKYL